MTPDVTDKLERLRAVFEIELGTRMALTDKIIVRIIQDSSLHVHFITAMMRTLATEADAVSYPKDWWQSFKARWFPAWLERRFPVIWVRKSFTRYCPHTSVKDMKTHFDFLVNGPPVATILIDSKKGIYEP